MNYALSLLKEIIKKRKLVWDLGKADFRKRFVVRHRNVPRLLLRGTLQLL